MPESDIVFHRRTLALVYFVLAIVSVVLGILLALVAVGTMVDKGSRDWMVTLGFAAGGLSWILGSTSLWSTGHHYQHSQVRIGRSEMTLATPSGEVIVIPYADIQTISWNPSWRVYQCSIATRTARYRLEPRVCPRPGAVARLIAERSGHPLQVG